MSLDQASGLRRLLGNPRARSRRRRLPVASVLGAQAQHALERRLQWALEPHGIDVAPFDPPLGGAYEVLLELTERAAAVTEAYAFVKAAHRRDPATRFRLLFAGTAPAHARALAARMALAAQRFLGAEIAFAGALPRQPDAGADSLLAATCAHWRLPLQET